MRKMNLRGIDKLSATLPLAQRLQEIDYEVVRGLAALFGIKSEVNDEEKTLTIYLYSRNYRPLVLNMGSGHARLVAEVAQIVAPRVNFSYKEPVEKTLFKLQPKTLKNLKGLFDTFGFIPSNEEDE